jgi:hypothetical protein
MRCGSRVADEKALFAGHSSHWRGSCIDGWTGGLLLGLALWIRLPLVLWIGAVIHENTPWKPAVIYSPLPE